MFLRVVWDLDDTLIDTSSLLLPVEHSPELARRIERGLPLLPGAVENLDFLSSRCEQHLVTQGPLERQNSKFEHCGLSRWFRAPFFVSDREPGKTEALAKIGRGCSPEKVLVIGNRRHLEIRQGKSLGYRTCLFMHGEHQDEGPEQPEDQPDFTARNHFELVRKCSLLNRLS